MADYSFGLTTIGNALVDVLAHVSDEFLKSQEEKHGVKPRTMNLIDEERAINLYADLENSIKQAGGSAANTSAAYASFGGKGAYIGKVSIDTLGQKFAESMHDLDITYHTTPLAAGPKTGRSMIMIEEDGHRTMNTFLGAAVELRPEDIDADLISSSLVTYLEGYLFDPAHAKEAFYKAAKIAHEAGRKVSLTLSDPFCVDRHREDFQDLVENHIDILFANEEEAKSLYKVDSWDEVLKLFSQKCEITCLTRSEKGSVILAGDQVIEIDAEPVDKVEDTTGAGDAYAAGVLYGYTQGLDLATCGKLGSIAAAEIISHIGPRPQQTLADLIPRKAA